MNQVPSRVSSAFPLIALVFSSLSASCALAAGPLPSPPTAPPLGPTSTPSLSPTTTPPPPPQTATPSPLDDPFFHDLLVVYTTKDHLWSWSAGEVRELHQRSGPSDIASGIFRPVVSNDAKWIAFFDETIPGSYIPHRALWLASTDAGLAYPLLQPDALEPLFDQNTIPLLDEFEWGPQGSQLLFNTERFLEGPPGSWPNFDLYSIDTSATISRLAMPGEGGRFSPSPDGRYVAVATTSEIAVIDLLSSDRQTLLQFDPFLMPCECYRVPRVTWTPDSSSILVSIPPADLLYPDEYDGKSERVWRLPLDAAPRVVFEIAPLGDQLATISFSPDAFRLAYLRASESCGGHAALHIYDLATSTDRGPLHCISLFPEWTPDSAHYLFSRGQGWELGNINDSSTETLPFLSGPADPDFHSRPELQWIDNSHFLLTLRTRTTCSLSIATLQGIIAEIARTTYDGCPDATYGFLTNP